MGVRRRLASGPQPQVALQVLPNGLHRSAETNRAAHSWGETRELGTIHSFGGIWAACERKYKWLPLFFSVQSSRFTAVRNLSRATRHARVRQKTRCPEATATGAVGRSPFRPVFELLAVYVGGGGVEGRGRQPVDRSLRRDAQNLQQPLAAFQTPSSPRDLYDVFFFLFFGSMR